MTKNITCIICPNGCDLEINYDETAAKKSVNTITGNLCPRGEKYGRQELESPMRTIASSIYVSGGELPLASVRTNKSIPKEKIFDVMEHIRAVRITAPVCSGDIVIKNVCDLGADIIVTKSVERNYKFDL